MSVTITKHYFTKNECYKVGAHLEPKGFMIHSTGADNPNLSRYIDDPKNLGPNKYNNHWNQFRPDGRQVCVHGFIGLDKNKKIKVYNTLPTDMQAWHCGGSANTTHIGYEICEDNLKDKDYFEEAMDVAMEVCAYYCMMYDFSYKNVISHAEGYKKGVASNHGDIDYWLKKYNKDMNWFREGVKKKIKALPKPKASAQIYSDGSWGNNKKNGEIVGKKGYRMRAIRMNATSTEGNPYLKFRVRNLKTKQYYNYQYDRTVDKNGENFAGDLINTYDRIQVTLENYPGWEAKYRVETKSGWHPFVIGSNNVNTDGFAGIDGEAIMRFEIDFVKV